MNGEKPKANRKPVYSRSHAQRTLCRDTRDLVTWAGHAAQSAVCLSGELDYVVQYMDAKAPEDLGLTKRQRNVIANAADRLSGLAKELKGLVKIVDPIAQQLNPEERGGAAARPRVQEAPE